MRYEDLPQRWKERMRAYLEERGELGSESLRLEDFPLDRQVRLSFDDGSEAVFRYPCVLEAPHLQEICVFTEHCGHHIFPSVGLVVEWEER